MNKNVKCDISELDTEMYLIKHLTAQDLEMLKSFKIDNLKGVGLQNYLRYSALQEELQGVTRTYLICEKETKEIVAYFSIRTGLITQQAGLFSFKI